MPNYFSEGRETYLYQARPSPGMQRWNRSGRPCATHTEPIRTTTVRSAERLTCSPPPCWRPRGTSDAGRASVPGADNSAGAVHLVEQHHQLARDGDPGADGDAVELDAGGVAQGGVAQGVEDVFVFLRLDV